MSVGFVRSAPTAENPVVAGILERYPSLQEDYGYEDEWSGASLLYVEAMPPKGGDICFADLYAAYDALSSSMQGYLATLEAVHRATTFARGDGKRPQAVHPLVRAHPESGRTTLFVSPGFTVRICEVGEAESRELLDMLFAHATRPEVHYRHKWRPGQLVACDNRATMHCATGGYAPPARRTLFRAIVGGIAA